MTGDEARALELALHRLEGAVNTGFARVQGELNLLSRGEAATAQDVQDLRSDVNALKDRSFPLPVITGIMSVAAVGLSLASMVGRG